ncbi:hypothetical protein GPECTOR_17g966 [Gonium pectorale]|uniref:RNase III domain-containing protein n=1 Tax=Gonium pectorale TaxID=33097 RepID=A0A150GKL3_GONPE|nr:hypothetical protein GPECTOR_17g966 [Gonium pectorale]|eukprot:KXZ50327.1 hypothetical protein GPECTOR_17g966 [Gonium pectorale]
MDAVAAPSVATAAAGTLLTTAPVTAAATANASSNDNVKAPATIATTATAAPAPAAELDAETAAADQASSPQQEPQEGPGRGQRYRREGMALTRDAESAGSLALFPLDRTRWRLLAGLPCAMWRLEGLVAAEELLREKLVPAGFAPGGTGGTRTASLVLTAAATTTPAARDPAFNNDALEFLGDSLLKLLAHDYVFLRERHVATSHEGVLSFMRDAIVANELLARYARGGRLGLQHVLRVLPAEPPRAVRQARLQPDEDEEGNPLRPPPGPPPGQATGGAGKKPKKVPKWCQTIVTRVITGVKGKRLADGVEALVGAHAAPVLAQLRGSSHPRGQGQGQGRKAVDGESLFGGLDGGLTCGPALQVRVSATLTRVVVVAEELGRFGSP